MPTTTSSYLELDGRRKRLGMSRAVLAKRAGVSAPTVTRILTGREDSPLVPNVQSIAAALGVAIRLGAEITVEEHTTVDQLRWQQAIDKAQRLVRIVQGTMGLESQAVDSATLAAMVNRTAQELLAGSPRKLWDE